MLTVLHDFQFEHSYKLLRCMQKDFLLNEIKFFFVLYKESEFVKHIYIIINFRNVNCCKGISIFILRPKLFTCLHVQGNNHTEMHKQAKHIHTWEGLWQTREHVLPLKANH